MNVIERTMGVAALVGAVLIPAAQADERRTSTPTIVISFDGAQPGKIEELIRSGKLPRSGGFGTLIREGTRAEEMNSVFPTVTATNHVSLATGAYVEKTNIPANSFHDTTTALTATVSGFAAPIEAETLWEAAKRQGKKVITIAFAGADGRGTARRGDQTLGFGVVDAFSAVKTLNASHFDAASANAWNLGTQSCEFKKANLATATANQVFFSSTSLGRADVNVLVCDTIFDGQEKYDTAFFDFDKNLANGFIARMKQGEWAPFKLPLTVPPDAAFPDLGRGVPGAWVKLLAFDPTLSTFSLYLGNVSHNVGYPQSFVDEIDANLGFWPAEPDFFNFEPGRINLATYMEQLERLAVYLKDAMILAMKNHPFDLLMGYQVQTDEAGHEFSLTDPRQQGYSDTAKRQSYADSLNKAYEIADANLKAIIDFAQLWKTNVIAVSDHGMAPMHTVGFPNRILRAAGLVTVTSTGAVDASKSKTNAVTVGGAANIYINLIGREPSGVVLLEKYQSVQNDIETALKAIRDPVTNEPVFEVIVKRSPLQELLRATSPFQGNSNKNRRGNERDFHVFGEDSGDVVAATIPGYHLDFNAGTGSSVGDFFQPSTFFGQHGYDPKHPEMKAIFYAAGPDFKKRKLESVEAVDVAPTVADALAILPPADAQGKRIK